MDVNPSDYFHVWRDLDPSLSVISSHLCIQAALPSSPIQGEVKCFLHTGKALHKVIQR